jgi:hypothetical protein
MRPLCGILLAIALPLAPGLVPGGSLRAQAVWRLADRPSAGIGVVDGDERYALSYVRAVVRTSGGGMVVADGDSGIRIYDRSGMFIGLFGEDGEGPGEVRRLGSMFAYRGDSIAVADSRLRRISIFDANGRFGRSFTNPVTEPPDSGGIAAVSSSYVHDAFPDGSFLVEPPEFLPNEPGGARRGVVTLLRIAADGSRVDTIGAFDATRLNYDPGAPNRIRRLHLTSSFTYAISGGLVYGGTGERPVLTVVGPAGQRHPDVPLPLPMLPVTAAVRQTFEDSVRAYFGRYPDVPESETQRILAGEFPDTIPAFANMHSDAAGRLWLAETPPSTVNEMRRFRIVDTAGRWIASIELPPRTNPRWIGENEIIVVQRDDLDVNYVRVYTLVKS